MKYTVCVPTLNARALWPQFWGSLAAQSAAPNEVIVLDSDSTDGTGELAAKAGARVITITRSDFRHGATRQRGAELAEDVDVLLYLTQDSMLADQHSVKRLLTHFENPSVGAAYGRQLPRRDAGPIEAHARLFNYPERSALCSIECAPKLGFKAIFFSNTFGAYRRSALMEVGGFPLEADFGEDTQVIAKMLLAGGTVAYAADSAVFHSHAYSIADEFRRYMQVGKMHAAESWLEHHFGKAAGEGLRFVRSELSYLASEAPHLCPAALLRTAIKYAGYKIGKRKGARGRVPVNIPNEAYTKPQNHRASRFEGALGNESPALAQDRHE